MRQELFLMRCRLWASGQCSFVVASFLQTAFQELVRPPNPLKVPLQPRLGVAIRVFKPCQNRNNPEDTTKKTMRKFRTSWRTAFGSARPSLRPWGWSLTRGVPWSSLCGGLGFRVFGFRLIESRSLGFWGCLPFGRLLGVVLAPAPQQGGLAFRVLWFCGCSWWLVAAWELT